MSIGTTTSIQGASAEVVQAIQSASQKTGVDFGYLVDQARAESSFRPEVHASTSSAVGLYQFIESTWMSMVKKHGADHGFEQYANQIETDFQGRNFVSDDAMRQTILDLRKDPEIASLMAAELASDNQSYLEQKIGRDVTATDLYFAHFLGAGGASKFLNALKNDPNQSAADVMPSAARSNKNIFYNSNGSDRSLKSVFNHFDSKFSNIRMDHQVSSNENDADTMGEITKGNTPRKYQVDPQFSRFYSPPVMEFVSNYPSMEHLKTNGVFTSLFQNNSTSRMQNQIIDPTSFLILTGLDSPK